MAIEIRTCGGAEIVVATTAVGKKRIAAPGRGRMGEGVSDGKNEITWCLFIKKGAHPPRQGGGGCAVTAAVADGAVDGRGSGR